MINIVSEPIIVPKNYLGASCNNISSIPINNNKLQLTRSWDYNSTYGNNKTCVATFINPSPGVYDWNTFDAFVSNNSTKDIIFVLGAPPDYLVTRPAVGSSYKGVKGNMCPDNLDGWGDLVQLMVNRAKSAGIVGAMWQLFNEMNESASYNDTFSLLGPYTRATAVAIKEVDPTAKILSPPPSGTYPTAIVYISNYLMLSDGSGGYVKDWIDGITYHHYSQSHLQPISTSYAYESGIHYYNSYAAVRGVLLSLGLAHLPIHITETGVLTANPLHGIVLQRRALIFAACGASSCLLYSYDAPLHAWQSSSQKILGINEILKPGAIITECSIGYGVIAATVDGTQYFI